MQREVMLVILRARRPIVLAAGPFGTMSYELLVMVRYFQDVFFVFIFYSIIILFADCEDLIFIPDTFESDHVKCIYIK